MPSTAQRLIRCRPGLRTIRAIVLAAGLLGAGAAAASTSTSGRTWANPVDLDYRYNYEQMNQGISYRTGADPAVVRYHDVWYLFLTLADGSRAGSLAVLDAPAAAGARRGMVRP